MSAQRATRRLGFWVAVGGASIITNILMNLAADRFPAAQGLVTLEGYAHRRNG